MLHTFTHPVHTMIGKYSSNGAPTLTHLYISARFEDNPCAMTHLTALGKIVKPENIGVLRLDGKHVDDAAEPYGLVVEAPFPSVIQKFWRLLHLRCTECSKTIEELAVSIVKSCGVRVVFIEDSRFGPIANVLKRKCPEVRVVVFYHDINRMLTKQELQQRRYRVRFLPSFFAIRRGEALASKTADHCLVMTDRDATLLANLYHRPADSIIPMSVPDAVTPEEPKCAVRTSNGGSKSQAPFRLLFVGAYYWPNLLGLGWFVDKVFSNLPGNFSLTVVGRGMGAVVSEIGHDPRITVYDKVQSLAEFYMECDTVIAPVFGGGGMKQKTAEALSYGKRIVCTTESAIGYERAFSELSDNLVCVSDSPDEQLNQILRMASQGSLDSYPDIRSLFDRYFSLASLKDALQPFVSLSDSEQ